MYSSPFLLVFTPDNLERQPLPEEWLGLLTDIEQKEEKMYNNG